eukprot:3754581-Rhodomonas_salina.2
MRARGRVIWDESMRDESQRARHRETRKMAAADSVLAKEPRGQGQRQGQRTKTRVMNHTCAGSYSPPTAMVFWIKFW